MSSHARRKNVHASLVPIRRPNLASSAAGPRPSCSIDARLETTTISGARLLDILENGTNEFILSSADGSLTARVRLVVNGIHSNEERVGNGKIAIDWSRSTVASRAGRVTLSNTELRLLAALAEGDGAPMSRSALIRRIWPRDALPVHDRENALAVYVCSLRKRLSTIGLGTALETVRGIGYRVVF
jgi:DNA-binding response OmpR family regulator